MLARTLRLCVAVLLLGRAAANHGMTCPCSGNQGEGYIRAAKDATDQYAQPDEKTRRMWCFGDPPAGFNMPDPYGDPNGAMGPGMAGDPYSDPYSDPYGAPASSDPYSDPYSGGAYGGAYLLSRRTSSLLSGPGVSHRVAPTPATADGKPRRTLLQLNFQEALVEAEKRIAATMHHTGAAGGQSSPPPSAKAIKGPARDAEGTDLLVYESATCHNWDPTTGHDFVCKDCPRGFYPYTDMCYMGTGGCRSCTAGKYSDEAITSWDQCKDCDPGYGSAPGWGKCCLAGEVIYKLGDVNCTRCPVNTYAEMGDLNCTRCPPGTLSAEGSVSQCDCKACGIGEWADQRKGECVKCLPGWYAGANDNLCLPCAYGTVQPLEGKGACEVCPKDTFAMRDRTTCMGCPHGTQCFEGKLTILDNFFTSQHLVNITNETTLYSCPRMSCKGGHNVTCLPGYSGPLCANCDDGFFMQAGQCEVCPEGMSVEEQARIFELFITLFGTFFFLIFFVLVPCVIRCFPTYAEAKAKREEEAALAEEEEEKRLANVAARKKQSILRRQESMKRRTSGASSGFGMGKGAGPKSDDKKKKKKKDEGGAPDGEEMQGKADNVEALQHRMSKMQSRNANKQIGNTGNEAGGNSGGGGQSAMAQNLAAEGAAEKAKIAAAYLAALIRNLQSEKVKIVVAYLQVVNMFKTNFSIQWPPLVTRYLENLGAINLDLFSMMRTGCVVETTYYVTFTFGMLMPIILCVFVLVLYIVGKIFLCLCRRDNKNGKWSAAMFRTHGILLFLIFPGVSATLMRIFNCYEVEGVRYLAEDYRIACTDRSTPGSLAFDDVYLVYFLIGAFFVIAYPIGIPIYFWLWLFCNKRRMTGNFKVVEDAPCFMVPSQVEIQVGTVPVGKVITSIGNNNQRVTRVKDENGEVAEWITFKYYVDTDQDGTKESAEVWTLLRDKDGTMPFLKSNASEWFEYGFGWMYRAYEGGFWYWELVEFLRKFVLSSVIIFVAPGSVIQIIVGLIVCSLFLFLLSTFKPYEKSSDDFFQSLAFFTLNWTLICGITLRAGAEALDLLPPNSITIGMLGMNAVVLFGGVAQVFAEKVWPVMKDAIVAACRRAKKVNDVMPDDLADLEAIGNQVDAAARKGASAASTAARKAAPHVQNAGKAAAKAAGQAAEQARDFVDEALSDSTSDSD